MDKATKIKAIAAIATVAAFWALPAIFIYYLTPHFDAHTQNLYRYLAATIILWMLTLGTRRDRIAAPLRQAARPFLVTAVVNTAYQLIWASTLYFIKPGMAVLLIRVNVVFTAVLVYVLYKDERHIVRNWRYLAGMAGTLIGSIGILKGGREVLAGSQWIGVTLALSAGLFWSLYALSIKNLMKHTDPTVGFAYVAAITTGLLVPVAVICGDPARILSVPWYIPLVVVASGLICIGLTHPLYYYAIRHLGAAVSSTVILASPVFTVIISAAAFGERLTGEQLLYGLVLLGGAGSCIWAR
jgi:drug/metabolite transporter (DMT)-like permease